MPTAATRWLLARPERIRVTLVDDSAGALPLPLPSRRLWPLGIVFGAVFVIFAAIALDQLGSMRRHALDTLFDLVFVLFQGFWVLGWSVGVVVLLLLAVFFLLYGESARIRGGRLIHAPRLGPVKILIEYELSKIRNLRVERGDPGRGRVGFDYGDGERRLGDAMAVAEAERCVRTIQAAIDALGPSRDPGPAPPPEPAESAQAPLPPAEPAGGEEAPAAISPSGWALLGANLVPLAGIVVLGWELGEVMTLFWAENAVIGLFNVLKLVVVARWAALFLGPFFIGHYGGFMVGHFLFVYYLFVRPDGPESGPVAALAELFVPLWPALAALAISHGFSFFTNFLGRREYVGRTAGEQMAEPYKRVIVLHLTLIFGGWAVLLLRSPVPALIVLIVLKTLLDLRAHRREHRRPPRRVPARRLR